MVKISAIGDDLTNLLNSCTYNRSD